MRFIELENIEAINIEMVILQTLGYFNAFFTINSKIPGLRNLEVAGLLCSIFVLGDDDCVKYTDCWCMNQYLNSTGLPPL